MDMAKHFDQFFLTQEQRSKIAAAYTEMNGLDINPDRWYCDLFAYDSYGGHDDHDWLCNAPSERSEEYVIKGLEPLQAVYASDALENYSFRAAAEESGYRDEGLKIPTPRHSP